MLDPSQMPLSRRLSYTLQVAPKRLRRSAFAASGLCLLEVDVTHVCVFLGDICRAELLRHVPFLLEQKGVLAVFEVVEPEVTGAGGE